MDIDTGIKKFPEFVKGIIPYIGLIILILIFKSYIITPIRVRGNSMEPTLEEGDIMILDIISTKVSDLKRFDIVVVDQGKELLIKRVIGLPGEKLEYKSSNLYINGKYVEDPYKDNYERTENLVVNIPEGEYFVLGDNRHNSLDSRTFGTFSKKQIKGKSDLIVFPFHRFGFIKFSTEK